MACGISQDNTVHVLGNDKCVQWLPTGKNSAHIQLLIIMSILPRTFFPIGLGSRIQASLPASIWGAQANIAQQAE